MPPRKRNADDDDSLGGDGMTALEGEGAQQERAVHPNDADSDRDIDSFIAELGEEATYVLLRRFEGGDWVILDRLDVGDATAVAIKAKYGGGKFRARVVNELGQHGRQITFKIGGKPRNPDDDEAPKAKDELTERLDRLEKMIVDSRNPESGRDKLMEAVVSRLLAPQEAPKVDPLMGTLITALIAGKPNTSGIDPIKLQELLQGARKEGFDTGKELGEALAISTGEGDASVGSVLARQLPALTEILANAQKQNGTRRRVATGTATALPSQTPTTEPEPVTSDNPIAKYLHPVVPTILKWARGGKSAEVKAVNMLDDLTDTQRETIGGLAESDEFVEQVMSAVPEFNAADVHDWIVLFLTTIQNTLAPVEDGPSLTDEIEVPETPPSAPSAEA